MTITNQEKPNCFPLSLSQLNIWNLERAYPGTSINCISTTIRIKGRVDFSLLQRAVNLVVESDCSLRARIVWDGETPMQYHASHRDENFPLLDFSLTDEEGIHHWETTTTRETFPLIDSPLYRFVLFRIDERTAGVLVKTHHIISDGWTQANLCNRIGQTYLDLLSGRTTALEPAPSYRTHVETERQYLASEDFQADRQYWKDTIAKAGEPATIKSARSVVVSPVGRRCHRALPQVLNHAIYSYCREKRIAPFAVFYMALAIYLKKIGGDDRSIIGVPIFNRVNYAFKQTSGMFVSTVPFINELNDTWSLNEFNDHLAENWFEMLRHQRFPFPHIVALSGRSDPLFHIVLSYQDSKILESNDASVLFAGNWHYGGYQAEHLAIHLTNLEDNRKYTVDYDYLTQVFTDDEIEELHTYICHILTAMLKTPDCPVRDLVLLSRDEQERVLYAFNQTRKIRHANCLYGAFLNVAEAHPDRVALIHKGERTTYRSLYESGKRVAAAIGRERGLVAILLPKTPELYTAMVGVMQAGSAWLILPPELPPLRIREILRLSDAHAIITSADIARDLDLALASDGQTLIDIHALPDPIDSFVATDFDDLAYVVYTSGSTGKPKGVEICQGNLLNLATGMQSLYARGAILSICNPSFDAFILESAAALLNGRTIVLPEERELENPGALADLVTGYAVGFLAITPSRLSELLKHPRFLAAMRGMESIICGGESFPRELLGRLALCTDARIYNQYGPSETTVAVSYKLLSTADRITAGKPMENCLLYVLDEKMQPLPIGVLGELYIGGQNVGRGYRNMPELTAQCFLPNPFETSDTLYRTGDVAFWTANGEMVIAGRRDRQVKLRGLRIELQEIADCLASYPGVTGAAAKISEQNDQPVLLAYYAAEAPLSEPDLLAHTASYLPHYMIPSRIIRIDRIPLAASGKVDESLLPCPEQVETIAHPTNQRQQTIVSIFREILGRPDIHAGSDYFLSGGNSLNAMEAIGRLEEATGTRLRVSDLYACRNARQLDEFIAGHPAARPAPHRPIEPAPAVERYPLTPTQKNIYLHTFLDPTGLSYNMPGAFRLRGRPDFPRLTRAFRALLLQDEIFHAAFSQEDGDLFARFAAPEAFVVEDIAADCLDEAFRKFSRPFDLARAPLFRAGVFQEETDSCILLVDMHHIIGDGISTPIILERLNALYMEEEDCAPPPLPLSYKDYAWHMTNAADAISDDDLAYWRERLTPLPVPLDLPLDWPRPPVFDCRGRLHAFSLPAELSLNVDRYCEKNELTPFMLFSGIFAILLSRLSGQPDIVVGTPVSYRDYPELTGVVGPLIGALPLRLSPAGDLSDYWKQVRTNVLGLLDHKNLPLADILRLLEVPRDSARNPLYQALFSLRPLDSGSFHLAGEPLQHLPLHGGSAKLDLSLEASRQGDVWAFYLEYAESLFLPETIALYGRSFETLLRQLTESAPTSVDDLGAISTADRRQYFERPGRTFRPYLNIPLPYLFEETAGRQPDETAVIWRDSATTFAQLDEQAARIAGQIVASGALPGDRIGFCLSRTPALLAGMFGILKAGCAYVPILHDYPEQRINYMLDNAGARLLLCDHDSAARLPENLVCPIMEIDAAAPPLAESIPIDPADPIYVLYTSGSTGTPKGVALPHRAIANLLDNISRQLNDQPGPVLCSTNYTFDIFITESLLALAQGLTVVLADAEEMLLPWELARLITRHRVRIAQFTPSRLQLNLNNIAFADAAQEIAFVILVGENVTPQLVSQFKAHSDGRFMNMYGPTEAAVYVTVGEQIADTPVTIGVPFDNCRIYVLDQHLKPVLPTARGELYLAGECLADGYMSRPDLTEQAFLPDPFLRGQRMYRSGDTGRQRADGTFECLGRNDSQIKVNGNRVELDEINEALLHGGAGQAATVHITHPDGSVSLHSFITPKTADLAAIRAGLDQRLPAYMQPTRIIALADLPYNSSGKADLPLLREWAHHSDQEIPRTSDPIEPLTPVELSGETAVECDSAPADTPAPAATIAPKPVALGGEAAVERDSAPVDIPAPAATIAPKPVSLGGEAAVECDSAPADTPAPAATIMTEEDILAIWSAILGHPATADQSFFEQGGTSLAVLSVISQYFNRGAQLTMAQFYSHPTASQQAALLGASPLPAAPAAEALHAESTDQQGLDVAQASDQRHAETSPVESTYQPAPPVHAPPDAGAPISASSPQTVRRQGKTRILLTGATGFLGAHLLHRLLDDERTEVVCLLRGGDRERLINRLTWYFGAGWVLRQDERIITRRGDIAVSNFGMEAADYRALTAEIDRVYHAAADVRHFTTGSDSTDTNLHGTEEVVRFALAAGADLAHISTVSVGGDFVKTRPDASLPFTEEDYDIGQNWEDNIYVKTKFLAEGIVFRAMKQGLSARIFRVGRLVGRSSDGVFQIQPDNNQLFRLIRGILKLGAIPESLAEWPIDLTPVDVCAESVVRLMEDGAGAVYHIIHPHPPSLARVVTALMPECQMPDDQTFRRHLAGYASANDSEALASLIEVVTRMSGQRTTVWATCDKTQADLAVIGYGWPAFSPETVLRAFVPPGRDTRR